MIMMKTMMMTCGTAAVEMGGGHHDGWQDPVTVSHRNLAAANASRIVHNMLHTVATTTGKTSD